MKKEIREEVWNKYNKKCSYCGEEIKYEEMQVDHLIPQSRFKHRVTNNYKIPSFLRHLTINDMNHIDNLMPACRVCNRWKKVFDLELFRSEIFEQIKRLNKYSANYRLAKKYELIDETLNPIIFHFEK